MNILGVVLDTHLTFAHHIDKVVSAGAQSLYALKTLKAHGLNKIELSNVCRATLISKLTYASPSWWGFVSILDKASLQALVSKAIKWGLYDQSMPSISQICQKSDDILFKNILINTEHVLHQFLPPRQTHSHLLRARPHDRQLGIASTLQSKSFLIRMLSKDTY
jgi:hypothetical protein